MSAQNTVSPPVYPVTMTTTTDTTVTSTTTTTTNTASTAYVDSTNRSSSNTPSMGTRDKLVSEITSVSDQDTTLRIQGLAINALHARSLLWFEKLMTAGLNLQALLDSDGETILPLMADLSPARLGTWLEGMTFGITQDRKSTRLNFSHSQQSRMPSSA